MAEKQVLVEEVYTEDNWSSFNNCDGLNKQLFTELLLAGDAEAKAVCQGCKVSDFCLKYAAEHPEEFAASGIPEPQLV